ncbi:MAG: sugar phosphate isomerase/epimerase [Planctomycetales bacterium]|nr:sugar phosphate isomerase/epimerase [Planctomycetales bacterium]
MTQPLRVGIQLASLRQPLAKAMETAARLGADGVELDARHDVRPGELGETARRHLRKKLDDYNLKVAAIAFPTRRGYEVAEDLDRRIDATKQAMRLAYDLGARALLNYVGRIEDEGPGRDRLLQALEDIGRHGQHVGVWLCATTGAESPERLRALIDELAPGSLAVNLDPGALLVNDESPREAVSQLGPWVQHVRASDGVRDFAKRQGIETQLGRGAADYPELIAMLEEHRYSGYYTIQRLHATDPVAEIQQSVNYLRALQGN